MKIDKTKNEPISELRNFLTRVVNSRSKFKDRLINRNPKDPVTEKTSKLQKIN